MTKIKKLSKAKTETTKRVNDEDQEAITEMVNSSLVGMFEKFNYIESGNPYAAYLAFSILGTIIGHSQGVDKLEEYFKEIKKVIKDDLCTQPLN